MLLCRTSRKGRALSLLSRKIEIKASFPISNYNTVTTWLLNHNGKVLSSKRRDQISGSTGPTSTRRGGSVLGRGSGKKTFQLIEGSSRSSLKSTWGAVIFYGAKRKRPRVL